MILFPLNLLITSKQICVYKPCLRFYAFSIEFLVIAADEGVGRMWNQVVFPDEVRKWVIFTVRFAYSYF